jgi:hypothetical protein
LKRLLASSFALWFAAACTDTAGQASVTDASADGTTIQVPDDSGAPSDSSGEGAAPIASTIRVANLSPDLGAVDVCLRASGSSAWNGPLFAAGAPAQDGGGADAAMGGVASGAVSDYLKMNGSGTFDTALVAAGDLSCTRTLAVGQVTIDAGKWATIVVMGLAHADAGSNSALRLAGFVDDGTQDPTMGRVRFINAALDLGAVRGAIAGVSARVDVAMQVMAGQAATQSNTAPKVDALGYGAIAPLADPSSVVYVPSGMPEWSSAPSTLGIVARSVHTAILFREAADGGASSAVAWCNDIGGDCVILR